MNASKILIIIISAILLVACQTSMVWLKDGGSPQDLDQDNYQCIQEAEEQVSETYISFNGGTSTEDVSVTNVPLFNACMEARGWRKCPECDPTEHK
jgi:hypothetical protein